jgi:hypothetical protein
MVKWHGRCVVLSLLIIGLPGLLLTGCTVLSTVTAVPTPTGSQATPSSLPGSLTQAPQGTFEGFHERNTCEVIGGWAYDSSKPDTPISVEIYDGSVFLVSLVANTFRADLRDAGKGNGNHSFVFTPPAQLKDGKPHQISIRIAGTSIGLQGTPMSLTCAS